jgi:SagB-type dehydrogenase family enzyme
MDQSLVALPQPIVDGRVSLEATLARRRSVRSFTDDALDLGAVSQLVWAAQGTAHAEGHRTTPSAGALYPLELYVVAGRVEGLTAGVYRYRPRRHQLERVTAGDQRDEVAAAASSQPWVAEAPVIAVVTAVYERTTRKYGERGVQYVHVETGHAVQSLCLEAVALDLGTTMVGAFEDAQLKRALGLPPEHRPIAIVPVGRAR